MFSSCYSAKEMEVELPTKEVSEATMELTKPEKPVVTEIKPTFTQPLKPEMKVQARSIAK